MNSAQDQSGALARTVVLVGLMGAGKSSIGRLLAPRLGVGFLDADRTIEEDAGCSIAEFFARYGESRFRRTEECTIARLLAAPPHVLAVGGGAFMSPRTRAGIRERGVSVWIRADLDTLFERVARRSGRPLLETADPRATLAALMDERYPVYAEADLTVDSCRGPIEDTAARVGTALSAHFGPASRTAP